MWAYVLVGAVVGMIVAAHDGTLRGNPGTETETERISRLIKQLGDDAFAKREAASNELEAIGAPALADLRKAAASSDDAEIRSRAKRISARIAESTAKAELAKLQGVWTVASYEVEGKQLPGKDKRSTMTITGDKWVAKWAKDGGDVQVESGTLKIVNPEKSPLAVARASRSRRIYSNQRNGPWRRSRRRKRNERQSWVRPVVPLPVPRPDR